jgi:hypothetical protein
VWRGSQLGPEGDSRLIDQLADRYREHDPAVPYGFDNLCLRVCDRAATQRRVPDHGRQFSGNPLVEYWTDLTPGGGDFTLREVIEKSNKHSLLDGIELGVSDLGVQ